MLMKKWMVIALLLGAAGSPVTAVRAQGTPVALSSNEYSGHPLLNSPPNSYIAEDTSEFATVPGGTGVVFTQWSRGEIIVPAGADNGYAARGFVKDSSVNGPLVAVDSYSYFYFSVKVQPDYALTLTGITWKTQRSGSGPKYARWQYATQSGGFVFQDIGNVLDLSASTGSQTFPIPLESAILVDGGSAGDSLVFRILAWGANSALGTMRILNGTSFNATVLPLTLLSFTAQAQGQQAVLQWETAKESNVRGFEVQKSSDGRTFQSLDFVAAKNELRNSYRFADRLSAGKTFYRLKMIDRDETFSFSPVQELRGQEPASIVQLYPNPASELLTIAGVAQGDRILIFSLAGRLVKEVLVNGSGRYELEIKSLAPGPYTLYLIHGQDGHALSFVKQ